MALTNAELKSKLNKPNDQRHTDLTDSGGLVARHFKSGSISWYLRFRWSGKQAVMNLGKYPTISIKDARKERDRCKDLLDEGKDPRLEKKISIAANRDRVTVTQAVDHWFNEYVLSHRKHTDNVLVPLKMYILPSIGHMPVENLSTRDWVTAFKTMKNVPAQAGVVLKTLKQVLRFCKMSGYVESNALDSVPISAVGKPAGVRDRVLSKTELRDVWAYCNDDNSPSGLIARYSAVILMITGARSVELRLSKKDDFDLTNKLWTVPKENSKTKKEIIRPIPDRLIPYIVELKANRPTAEYLITRTHKDVPLTQSGFGVKFRLFYKKLGQKTWGAHVFRHTISTTFGDLGIEPFVAEKLLGHTMGGAMGVYNKSHYFSDQLVAMNKWIDYISEDE